MKKGIILFLLCLCMVNCLGCEKQEKEQTKQQEQIVGLDGLVTMSAELTEDESITLNCTIFNKTDKDISTGVSYTLQVLDGDSYIDVPLLPDAGGFDLNAMIVSAGKERNYRVYIENNYGDLEKGHYKIIKEYSVGGSNNQEKESVLAEFDLP